MLPSDWWYSQAIYPWKAITMQYEATSRNFMWGQAGHQFLCVCVCHQMLCQSWNSRSCSHRICFQDAFVTISFTVRSDLFSTGPKYLFYHPLILEPGLTPGQVVASQYQGLEENLKRCMHQDGGMKFAAGSCIFMYIIYIYVYTQHIDSKICGSLNFHHVWSKDQTIGQAYWSCPRLTSFDRSQPYPPRSPNFICQGQSTTSIIQTWISTRMVEFSLKKMSGFFKGCHALRYQLSYLQWDWCHPHHPRSCTRTAPMCHSWLWMRCKLLEIKVPSGEGSFTLQNEVSLQWCHSQKNCR